MALSTPVLVLAFPIRIIWQIKVRWTTKLALSFSLCLTAVLLALTVARVANVSQAYKRNRFDTSRNLFWMAIATFVSLILTSATALRSLFVAHAVTADAGPRRLPRHGAAAGNRGVDCLAADEGAVALRAHGNDCICGGGREGREGGAARCGGHLHPLQGDDGERRKNGGAAGGWGTRLLLSLQTFSREQNQGGSALVDLSASATSGSRTAARPTAPEPQGSLARLVAGSRLWWRLPDDSLPRGTVTGMRTFIWGEGGPPERRAAAAISGNDSAAATVRTEVTWETHTNTLAASV